MLWRPLVAALIMLAVTGALWSVLPLGALIAGAVVYVVVLMGLRPLNADEQARLGPLLPGRVRRVLRVGA